MQKRNSSHTAFLIVHGIGQQMPFEMLDAFTAGCWNALEIRQGGTLLPGKHEVVSSPDTPTHYISVGSGKGKKPAWDFYEYYWADKTQRTAKLADIVAWLVDTSEGARKYYDENRALAQKYERGSPFRNQRFDRFWYLKHLGWLMRALALFPGGLVRWVSTWFGPVIGFLNPIFLWIRTWIVDYIGDIVVYTTNDLRSQFFPVREGILRGATDALRRLLADGRYERIVVAGHSLGSVIAYDALNRLNQEMNMGRLNPRLRSKLSLFVTFGSPLDKIAFFFRDHTPDEQYLRRQLLLHDHSFKARPLNEQINPRELTSPFRPLLEDFPWLNFYDPEDAISGRLDFYRVDANIELRMGKGKRLAHTSYVDSPEMFKVILDALEGGPIDIPEPNGISPTLHS